MRSQKKIFLNGVRHFAQAFAFIWVMAFGIYYAASRTEPIPPAKNPDGLSTAFQTLKEKNLLKVRALFSYVVDGKKVSEIELSRVKSGFQKICVSVDDGMQVFCQKPMKTQENVAQKEQRDGNSIRYKIGPTILNEFRLQSLPSMACVIAGGYGSMTMDCFSAPDREGDKVGTFLGQSKLEISRFRYFQPALNPDVRCVHTMGRKMSLNCS